MTTIHARHPHRSATGAAVALASCLWLTGCGSSSSAGTIGDAALPQSAAATVTVTVTAISVLGKVLADGTGHVLYMFPPDAGGRVTCTGPCAGTWPPLAIKDGADPAAGPGVNARLLGTLPDPNTGGQVVTYGGYPLYRYVGDVEVGTAHGQAMFLNGGPWYVLDADGRPVTTDLHPAA